MKKVKLFLLLERTTKLLFLEAFILLGWARYLKTIPFSKALASYGVHMQETSYSYNEHNRKILKQISQVIYITSRYTFWESECLVKAIAAMKMLERRKVESTLYLGTGKDENGKFIAHAWLRSGPFYVTGSEGMEKFTVVSKFGKNINSITSEGETHG